MKILERIWWCSGMMLLTACTLIDEDAADGSEEPSVSVSATFAFTVSSESERAHTRMTGDVVQTTSNDFRGIQDIRIIPFRKVGTIESGDDPTAFAVNDAEASSSSSNRFYHYGSCSFMSGTASLLFYGRAKPVTSIPSGVTSDMYNGQLNAVFGDMTPANISFSLQQIYPTPNQVPTGGGTIAASLTVIANSTGWSTATESRLKAYYQNFIGQQNDGSFSVMAGSSANAQKLVDALKAQVEALSFTAGTPEATVRQNIIGAINGSPITPGYPASSYLPDGAAAVKWNGTAFTALSSSTEISKINSLTRFAYPPELWYYANSRICTSNQEVTSATYTSATGTWSDFLAANYAYNPAVVSSNSKAVAMIDPVEYAVGRLQMTLNSWPSTLQDATEQNVTASSTLFPMTGIIIGGQHEVGFDFKPKGTASDDRFIYDCQGIPAGGIGTVNTLVLESSPNEKVNIVLEFRNDSENSFVCESGIVYPGTKFYLIGEVDPTGSAYAEFGNRVFIQDKTTEISMTVASLAKAYNVLPDLLSPRLEIGVKVDWNWEQTPPTNIPLP